MKRIVLGDHKGPPAYFNATERVRVGDMAAIHALLGRWHQQNPEDRLFVTYDPFHPIHEYSKQVPMEWAMSGVADEVWIREHPYEPLTPPGRETFDCIHGGKKTYIHLWAFWRGLMRSRDFEPKIFPPKENLERASATLKKYGVPDKFAVVQCLFDAGYHKYRNAPLSWWIAVASAARDLGVPVVLIGPTHWMRDVKVPDGIFPIFQTVSSPFDAMGLIAKSAVMVGGETGLPLWACLFKIPIVATFCGWSTKNDGGGKGLEYRPISFGAPVVYAQIGGPVQGVAALIDSVFRGQITRSTPV